jgi:hypothetical protein
VATAAVHAATSRRFALQSAITQRKAFHRGVVRVSLPPKGEARDRWLTRKKAATLIWHCWRHREKQTIHSGMSKGDPVNTSRRPLRHMPDLF